MSTPKINVSPSASEKIGGENKIAHFFRLFLIGFILYIFKYLSRYLRFLRYVPIILMITSMSILTVAQFLSLPISARRMRKHLIRKIIQRLLFIVDTLVLYLLLDATVKGEPYFGEVHYAGRMRKKYRMKVNLKPESRSIGNLEFTDQTEGLKYYLSLDYGSDNPCFYQTLKDLMESGKGNQRLSDYFEAHKLRMKDEVKVSFSELSQVLDDLNISYVRLALKIPGKELVVMRNRPKEDPKVVLIDYNPYVYPKTVKFFGANWEDQIGHVAYIRTLETTKVKTQEQLVTEEIPMRDDENDSDGESAQSEEERERTVRIVLPPKRGAVHLTTDPVSLDKPPVTTILPPKAYNQRRFTVRKIIPDLQTFSIQSWFEPPYRADLSSLLKQNEIALTAHDNAGLIVEAENLWSDMNETGLVEGIRDLVTGSLVGVAFGIVELALGIPKFLTATSRRVEPTEEEYNDIFIKAPELPCLGLTWIVQDGLYQGPSLEDVISKSKTTTAYSDTYRILGIDTTFNYPEIVSDVARYAKIDIGDRWGLGTTVPWYPKMHDRVFNGNIIFINEGPLHPLTAWNLWNYHSKCSKEAIVGIFWNNSTSFEEYSMDNYAFPHLTDVDGGWYYSWASSEASLLTHATTIDHALERKPKNICRDFSEMNMDQGIDDVFPDLISTGTFYYPVRQRIDGKCQPEDSISIEFVIHTHSVNRGDKKEWVKHFCLKSCCVGNSTSSDTPLVNGEYNRGIGLTSQYHSNLVSTLVNSNIAARILNLRKLLMAGNPQLSVNHLQAYEAAYLKLANHVAKSWVDPNVLVSKTLAKSLVPRNEGVDLFYAARRKKGKKKSAKEETREYQEIIRQQIEAILNQHPEEVYQEEFVIEYGHRKKSPKVDEYLKAYENRNIDMDDLLDVLYDYLLKHPKIREFYMSGGDVKLELAYAARKSKGLPLEEQEHHEKRCVYCRKFAPLKYKWVKGYCESCYYASRNNIYEHQVRAGDNLYYMPDSGSKLHYLPYPTILKPATPYYKPKPLRDNLKCEDRYNGRDPGWKTSRRMRTDKTSSGSQLVGVGIGTRGRVLNLGNKDVEEKTLQVRIFAKPISDANPGRFSKLFDFATKHGLLGDPVVIKPMPVIAYNFRPEGVVARDLLSLGIANRSNVDRYLYRLKKNVDEINERLWKITDWSGKTWISTFEPRKKNIYYRALLEFGKDKKKGTNLPKIDFSFFLKRELDTHGCDIGGKRPAMNPRIICNPSPISQVLAGPFLRPTTNHLHSILNLDNCGTYFGGLGPEEGNRWARNIFGNDFKIKIQNGGIGEENIVYAIIENDFSKFDATYNRDAFDFVYSVYRHWGLPLDNELFMHVLESWKQPKGKFRSGTLVKAPIMNASGRADTALMNALINYFVQLSAFLEVEFDKDIMEITPEQFKSFSTTFRIAVLGDDSLTVVKYKEGMENRVSEIIQEYGFEARDMKLHFDARRAVFLGNRLYPVIENGVKTISWGPTIGRRMFKMGTATDVQEDPIDWLRQVSEATIIQAGFVPLIGDIARKTFELTKHVNRGSAKVEEMLKYKQQFITHKTTTCDYDRIADYMEFVYDISVDQFVSMYTTIHSIERVPCIITCPMFDTMVTKDTCG